VPHVVRSNKQVVQDVEMLPTQLGHLASRAVSRSARLAECSLALCHIVPS
jgi:hypothetical protein